MSSLLWFKRQQIVKVSWQGLITHKKQRIGLRVASVSDMATSGKRRYERD